MLNILYYKDKYLIIILLEYFDKISSVYSLLFIAFPHPQITGMVNTSFGKKKNLRIVTDRRFNYNFACLES